ncbi:MAG TPA: hypothetical protein VF484_03080 [Candidatus Limnocylindrales bacterium]
MSWGGTLVAAALATVAHPRWWVLALAGFLVRGGIVLVLLPMIVPPTVAGVMSLVAPTVVGQVLIGGPNTPVALVTAGFALALILFAWIAGTLGAFFDAALVREAIVDDELGLDRAPIEPDPPGLGTARLGPHVLTAVVFAVAAAEIVQVVYDQATSPSAPATPFVERVVSQTPLQIAALAIAVVVAEAVGGLALRAELLDPAVAIAGVPRALARGIRRFLRPVSLATVVVTTGVVLVVGLPGAVATGRAWGQVRLLFTTPSDAASLAIVLVLFVAVAMGWLTLVGVALAWRSAVWTAVDAR